MRRTIPETGTSVGLLGMSTPMLFKLGALLFLIAASLYLATASYASAQQVVREKQETGVLPSVDNALAQSIATPKLIKQGMQVSLNKRILPVAWSQWRQGKSVSTGISDTGLMLGVGVELLNTNNYTRQPIQWFSRRPQMVATNLSGEYRYIDITSLAKSAKWQMKIAGDTLQISTPEGRVTDIQQEPQPAGEVALTPRRIVVDLDRPTPWQVSHQRNEAIVTIDASAPAALIERFNPPPPPPTLIPNPEASAGEPRATTEDEGNAPPPSISPSPSPSISPSPAPSISPSPIVQSSGNQTTIRLNVPTGWRPLVSTLSNPNRLVIDIAPDAVVERNILWAPGLRWRQQVVSIGDNRFPVVWLEVNQRQAGVKIKPILNNPTTLVGISPLIKTAPFSQAAAAINAGFFNRKHLLPLGAIRRDGGWLSSPILNRGAIAWNDNGGIKIGQLSMTETLRTSLGERLPILHFNSGYVQRGIARYTPEWGPTYTPLTDNEILVVVQNNTVTNTVLGGPAGQTAFPIPADGYLLTIRATPELNNQFAPGMTLRIESMTAPTDFAQYPHILGAGPVLIQNRQIVLDGKAEKFSDAFIQEKAIRSAIATTASGTLLIAAVHNRAGGAGPTLAELAQILQQMGAVDALNLDGGSSTSLYLGGQLIDRSPATAARVHNGIGIFLP